MLPLWRNGKERVEPLEDHSGKVCDAMILRKTERGSFRRLVTIMEKLREGCPWDREQTHESLLPYLQEETFEVVDAVRSGNPRRMRDELGDLMLQIVFQAQVAKESGDFDIDDVCDSIIEKLIRRHPHVFGKKKLDTPGQVAVQWEEIKKGEEGGRKSAPLMKGVPEAAPALQQAEIVQRRAARVGFDWQDIKGPLQKVSEEIREIRRAYASKDREKIEEEVGDLLFAFVNVCRFLDVTPEAALRRTNRKFMERFSYIEETAAARGQNLAAMTLEEMDALWDEAKRGGRT
jgi:tetrapyrrole methylase family protein/MazG family protein